MKSARDEDYHQTSRFGSGCLSRSRPWAALTNSMGWGGGSDKLLFLIIGRASDRTRESKREEARERERAKDKGIQSKRERERERVIERHRERRVREREKVR